MSERRVVCSGMGAISAFGAGTEIYREKLFAGKSGTNLIESFDCSKLNVRFAAQCPLSEEELDDLMENPKILKTIPRAGKFLVFAAQEAVRSSRLDIEKINPYRFGTSFGVGGIGYWDVEQTETLAEAYRLAFENARKGEKASQNDIIESMAENINPMNGFKYIPNIPTAHVAIQYNARGNSLTIATACSSSAQAFGEAFSDIKSDRTDLALAGGADSNANPTAMLMFDKLGVLSRNNAEYRSASRPFDKKRDGFVVGEGGAVFLLEELEHCMKRGGTPLFEIVGYGATSDAFRLSDPPPTAWGGAAAMKAALKEAKLAPEEIDYVNAHGTSTKMNDKAETFALKEVFGDAAKSVPISSTKSMIGHGVAAAGALELVACALAIDEQAAPPTINYSEFDPDCDLDYIPNKSRNMQIETILKNSFGFGSQNACLIVKKYK